LSSIIWGKYENIDERLLRAAKEGQLHRVRRLLNSGADVDATTALAETALHLAAEEGNREVVEALILAGADVNHAVQDDFHSVLRHAIHSKDEAIVRALLLAGAKVWPTALFNAASGGLIEIVQILITAGADVNAEVCPGKTTLRLLEDQLVKPKPSAREQMLLHYAGGWGKYVRWQFMRMETAYWKSFDIVDRDTVDFLKQHSMEALENSMKS
jgi:ankyrin repeat protein